MADVHGQVEKGNVALNEMIESMRQINTSSEKIAQIIKVIDEIAFQTNILALNAAVEAARAGEAGMGFAVVAEEVRNLAQRSAQASRDTATLIQDSIASVRDGRARLGQVTGSIRTMTDGAARVKVLIDEVNTASHEQARGVEQIARTVAEMDGVTQTAAASAEQSASASEQLSAQAETMKAMVSRLRTLVGQ